MVDPSELTQRLFDECLKLGATFHQGHVKQLETIPSLFDDEKSGTTPPPHRVTQVHFQDGNSLQVGDDEDVVVALGPWSSRVEDWLTLPLPVEGVVSTSLTWDFLDGKDVDDSFLTQALFCAEDERGCHLEIFPRRRVGGGRQLYVSGCGESEVWSPAVFRSSTQSPDPAKGPCQPNPTRAKAAHTSLQELAANSFVCDGRILSSLKSSQRL